jgi:RNA polymerase sigma factor (sigma-70 family)
MARTTTAAPDCNSHTGAPIDSQRLVELVAAAQRGDRAANEELLVRSLPRLRKVMRGRVPPSARGYLDTCDVLQDAAVQTLSRLAHFRPEHEGSMPAFMGRVIKNRVLDEFRRTTRRPKAEPLDDGARSDAPSPLATLLEIERQRRWLQALRKLRAKDRRLIIARIANEESLATIARRFGLPTTAAAGMAVRRAEERLRSQLAG